MSGLQVGLWGVRGSLATPDKAKIRYGGNTSCLDVTGAEGERVIFDAGTGLFRRDSTIPAADGHHVFLTHFHRDHIEGIPFFSPLYQAEQAVTFHVPACLGGVKRILQGFLRAPYSPIGIEEMSARITFNDFEGGSVRIGSLNIQAFELNHPQRCFGYRVEGYGSVVVYATDHEHGLEKPDANLRSHAEGADLLIYDAHYTVEEYEHHRGWGHSTWLEGTRLANAAGVKRLLLFHHHPARTDECLDDIVYRARKFFFNTGAAQEGAKEEV